MGANEIDGTDVTAGTRVAISNCERIATSGDYGPAAVGAIRINVGDAGPRIRVSDCWSDTLAADDRSL